MINKNKIKTFCFFFMEDSYKEPIIMIDETLLECQRSGINYSYSQMNEQVDCVVRRKFVMCVCTLISIGWHHCIEKKTTFKEATWKHFSWDFRWILYSIRIGNENISYHGEK